jgi:uncharacterized membrane protein YebE (DUF533 family)
VLVAYALLKYQLFDIDVKVKWTIKRGTIAAAFLFVFIVVAQLGQNFLSTEYGWAAGGLAAGALLFVLAPLQRVAERVADTAMPGVSTSSEYLSYRKLEVYKATIEGAMEDGAITEKERAMLGRLREKLGISTQDAAALEAEFIRRPVRQ